MKDFKISLASAEVIAADLIRMFGPVCERIEVAGSVRRQKPYVGDVEIVMVPKIEQRTAGLFESETYAHNLQFEHVQNLRGTVLMDRLDKNGRPSCGPGAQRMSYAGIPVDLFCVLPGKSWGVIFAIRTGPGDRNRQIVTQQSKGGVLPDHMEVKDGQLWSYGREVETPEEEHFFKAIGLPWLPPEDRREFTPLEIKRIREANCG